MLFLVADKGLVDALGQGIGSAFGQEIAFFVWSRDIAQLYQYTRHGGFSQDEESGLVNSLVDALGGILELTLDECCQLDALFHVLVLKELEDDVAFR